MIDKDNSMCNACFQTGYMRNITEDHVICDSCQAEFKFSCRWEGDLAWLAGVVSSLAENEAD